MKEAENSQKAPLLALRVVFLERQRVWEEKVKPYH